MQPAGELALLQFTSGSSGAAAGHGHLGEPGGQQRAHRADGRIRGRRRGGLVAAALPRHGAHRDVHHADRAAGDAAADAARPLHPRPRTVVAVLREAQHTAAPPFAYAYCARRVKTAELEGLDLSGWKMALIGAEPIDPHALEVFAQLVEPFGFSRQMFKPAYGMAETTLLVTMDNAPRDPLAVRPDPEALSFGQPVRILEQHTLGAQSLGAKAGWVVGCGTPEGDVPVVVVDDDGRELGEGLLGEIVVGVLRPVPAITRGPRPSRLGSWTGRSTPGTPGSFTRGSCSSWGGWATASRSAAGPFMSRISNPRSPR